MPRPLPIVWYVEDQELPDDHTRDQTVNQIADAVSAWEEDGTQTLNDLRATIERILHRD
jgi:hypothetical protein